MNFYEGNFEVPDEKVVEILKKKSPQERLFIAFGMWEFAKKSLLEFLRLKYPEWNDESIRREAAKRLSHGAV